MEKRKLNTVYILLGSVFTALGAVILAAGIYNIAYTFDMMRTGVQLEAEITDINRVRNSKSSYNVVNIAYEYHGETYGGYYDYSPNLHVGDKVTIYCDSDYPTRYVAKPSLTMPFLPLLFFVLMFGGPGVFLLFGEIKRQRTAARLIEDGKYLICTEFTERASNVRVNKVRQYCIDCTYTDVDGRTYTFTSDIYPPRSSPYTAGQPVKVYVDLYNDPTKYYVSTEPVKEAPL